MTQHWMIYGANGYTGELIARQAVAQGLRPVLAGRSADKLKALAAELGLEHRVFALDQPQVVHDALFDMDLVLHCAGPFSATSAPMIEGCLSAGAHYLDITGEAAVFEHAHRQTARAREAGVVVCPGVGFDVIPTDCVAAKLKQVLPDAQYLSLGFQSATGPSPGTSKTLVEGLSKGSMERRDGRLVSVPLGSKHRDIDFGRGPRSAMAIPWGDVSTAYYTTGIPNIDTWIPLPKSAVYGARVMNLGKAVFGLGFVQNFLKRQIDRRVKGPDLATRDSQPTHVWGEARNAAGETRTVRIRTNNVYSLTVDGALAVATWLLNNHPQGGSYTPAMLMGPELVESLPGSGRFEVS